jgi:hypothetical protein
MNMDSNGNDTREWNSLIEYMTTEVLHTISDGKYDPENDEAELHPGTIRNRKTEIKKNLTIFYSQIDFTSDIGKAHRELLLSFDKSNRTKQREHRDALKQIKELKKALEYANQKYPYENLEEAKVAMRAEVEAEAEERFARADRFEKRCIKYKGDFERMTKQLEAYRTGYIPREEYTALRDNLVAEEFKAKQDQKRQKKENQKAEAKANAKLKAKEKAREKKKQSAEKKKKALEKKKQATEDKKQALEKQALELEKQALELELICLDSDSSESDSSSSESESESDSDSYSD